MREPAAVKEWATRCRGGFWVLRKRGGRRIVVSEHRCAADAVVAARRYEKRGLGSHRIVKPIDVRRADVEVPDA